MVLRLSRRVSEASFQPYGGRRDRAECAVRRNEHVLQAYIPIHGQDEGTALHAAAACGNHPLGKNEEDINEQRLIRMGQPLSYMV